MKTFAKYLCAFLLLGAAATATAQSTWSYFISDAGNGESLVTWNVSGALVTSPGAGLLQAQLQAIPISAPGMYVDSYLSDGTAQSIPTPDGSYFSGPFPDIFITGYYTYDTGSGDDGFGLLVPLTSSLARRGDPILYDPGTQSIVIPVAFSDFNPGTYQSESTEFSTPLTVNLTVESAPEPSTLALALGAVICAALMPIVARVTRRPRPCLNGYERQCRAGKSVHPD